MMVNLLLAFTLVKDLGLLLSSLDLGSVLLFLDLLSGGLDLGNNGVSDQSVLWLKLLGLIKRVVDQTEASGLATTELGLEAEDEQKRLRDFALESIGEVPRQHEARDAPELGKNIAVDENDILDLTIETGNEAKLSLGATIGLKAIASLVSFCRCSIVDYARSYLALVEDLLGNLALEDLRGLSFLKDFILSER